MSLHQSFRRQPVPGQMAMQHSVTTLPAPIRGIIEVENWAYTKPGTAVILDNWFPTQKGLKLRGGTERWCTLPAPTEIVRSGFEYVSGNNERMFAATQSRLFDVSFADNPVLATGVGTVNNGNFSAAQMATASGDYLLAVNDTGQSVRRFNGTSWSYLDLSTVVAWANNTAYTVGVVRKDTTDSTYWRCVTAHTSAAAGTFAADRAGAAINKWSSTASDGVSPITGPIGTPVEFGKGLTYVWKYRNRLFFIQGGSMNAWYLPVNAAGGALQMIPLSGAAKRGGSLLFGASWSIDAGDGIDDKCIFMTDQGEVLIFTGTDPSNALNWRQEGRYDISKPRGKNGHQQLGGDVLIITVDGVVPLSAVTQKDPSALSLAAITYSIEQTWMVELNRKDVHPWTIVKWDEGNALFVNFPGGTIGDPKSLTVAVSNLHTGAWARYTGWDAMCWMRLRGSLFFGTQDGKILQVESTGYDDAQWDDVNDKFVGTPYACTMIGGWEMFQAPPNQVTWLQARTIFFSSAREPFIPQVTATTDYELRVPPPPNAGPDPGLLEVWDQGLWDAARWDQPGAGRPPARNTMWVSVGETGFTHAPIVQVTVGQQVRPDVELVSISATFLRMADNV